MGSMLQSLGMAWEVFRSKPLAVRMWGGAYERRIFGSFTGRHRLLLVQRKSFGVALFKFPAAGQPLFSGKQYQAARTNQTKATKAGYAFRAFEALEQIDGIMAINASAAIRQGTEIKPEYLNHSDVEAYCANPGRWFGVFDQGGSLKAYCHTPVVGEVVILSRLLGHQENLADGIMWLLVGRTAAFYNDLPASHEKPSWLMYDTYIGGGNGLREFKKRLGFRPYRVRWQWTDRPTGG